MKRAESGSGSVSQRYGYADPDLDVFGICCILKCHGIGTLSKPQRLDLRKYNSGTQPMASLT
jgi:hypothetical protein